MAIQFSYPQVETKPSQKLVTGEELYRMGDIGRAELIDGVIKQYMPTGHPHAYHELLLGMYIMQFVLKHKLGRALSGEVGIYIRRNPDTVRAADIAFISNERLAQATEKGFLDVAPELVVEVMSPEDSWSDVNDKLADYFSIDVKLIWIVDPLRRRVHVYRSLTNMDILTEADQLTGGDVLPGFTLSVSAIFAD
jgi:Uma2 family endonuclease